MVDPVSSPPSEPRAAVVQYASRQDTEAATLRALGSPGALIRASELERCAILLRALVAMNTGLPHIALLVDTRCRALAREPVAGFEHPLRLEVYEEARAFLQDLAAA